MKSEKEAPHGGSTPSGAGVRQAGRELVVPPSTAEQDHPATSRIAVGSLRDSGTWVFSVRMEKDYPHPQTRLGKPPQWNEEDYDVLANGEVVGRIIEANAGRNEVARETVLWKTWAWSRQASALIGPKGSSPC